MPLARLQALSAAGRIKGYWEQADAADYINAIPAAFSCLTSLTLLKLVDQHYVRGGWRHLKPLTQLQRLDLSWARLPRMPRGLVALYGLPLRIEVGARDTSWRWVQRFNERNARLLRQRRQQEEHTGMQPAAQRQLQPSWALRLLRRLAGGCACIAATE